MSNSKLFFLLILLGLAVLVRPVMAQDSLDFVVEKVEYDLAWPGILPDHPLYKVKMLRDKIWGFLIRDPLKKAQWTLLMADKRVLAAQMLLEKNKLDLAVSTASKAEKYLEKTVENVYEAKERGKTDKTFLDKLSKACLKHQEVLITIEKEMPDDLLSAMAKVLEYPQSARQKINELMP